MLCGVDQSILNPGSGGGGVYTLNCLLGSWIFFPLFLYLQLIIALLLLSSPPTISNCIRYTKPPGRVFSLCPYHQIPLSSRPALSVYLTLRGDSGDFASVLFKVFGLLFLTVAANLASLATFPHFHHCLGKPPCGNLDSLPDPSRRGKTQRIFIYLKSAFWGDPGKKPLLPVSHSPLETRWF